MYQDPGKKIVNDVHKLKCYLDALCAFKAAKLKIGFVPGTFDLFHRGHHHLLNEAARQCDFLVASVTSDVHVREKKGITRPIWPRENRSYAVASLPFVGAVLVMPPIYDSKTGKYFRDPIEWEILKPDIAFFGSDQSRTTLSMRRLQIAPEIVFITEDMGWHTSQTIEKITAQPR